jgi:hypothetical protein
MALAAYPPGCDAMRTASALLIVLLCADCALSRKPVAQTPVPSASAMASNPAPVAESSPRFECSDGTLSASQSDCMVDMAHARLPPGWNRQNAAGSAPNQPR